MIAPLQVDKIEPLLYPLLRQDLDRQGPRFVVQVCLVLLLQADSHCGCMEPGLAWVPSDERQTHDDGTHPCASRQVGDKAIDYNDTFRCGRAGQHSAPLSWQYSAQ